MKKRRTNLWGVLIIFIVFVSIIIAIVQHNTHDHQGNVEGYKSSIIDSQAIEMIQHANESPPLTVNVPADWVRVVQGGHVTWIDRATASSFQIQISESHPAILEVTRNSVAAELAAAGAEFVDFYWMSEWDFAAMYRTRTEMGIQANIEITAFNRQHIVRFVFAINETYFNYLEETMALVINSFEWNRFS